jgi:AraC-like DNA-binding protein
MLLYISLMLILLALILIVYNWKLNKNAGYVGVFFSLVATYGLTHYLTVYGKSAFWLAIFFNTISPFMLLSGPFLYFYVRGTLKDQQGLKTKDYLHFIPAVIHLIGISAYLFTPFSYKKEVAQLIIDNFDNIKKINTNLFFNYKFNFIFRLFLLFTYAVYSGLLLWKFSKKKNNHLNIPVKQLKITYRWLVSLIILVLFLVFNFVVLTAYFISYSGDELKQNTLIVNITTGIAFVFLAFGILFFPEILYGLPNQKNTVSKTRKKLNKTKTKPFSNDNLSIDIEKDPFMELADRIKDYFEKEKPYTNPNFSISDIALKLGVPQNHISYCLNSIFKVKFSKLKTELRIEYTKKLLQESVQTNFTIDGIAQMSDFSSRSNFYNQFKDFNGETPSEYLNSISKNNKTKIV